MIFSAAYLFRLEMRICSKDKQGEMGNAIIAISEKKLLKNRNQNYLCDFDYIFN